MTILLVLKISLVIFIVGNLLGVGLKLNPEEAFKGLRDVRFVLYTLVWGFVFGPALAYAITLFIPLEPPFALGLMLLGMAPSAPFLPILVNRVKGDMGYTAGFMLLTSMLTVLFIPLVVPLLAKGLSVSPWTIARPLLFLILLPMAMGMAMLRWRPGKATAFYPLVKKVTTLFGISSAVLSVAAYGRGMMVEVGSFPIIAQFIFFSVMAAASYWLSFGLKQEQRMIISMGMCTRNLGAALAPLFALTAVDERAIVMVMIGLPFMIIFAMVVSKIPVNKPVEADVYAPLPVMAPKSRL
jgi:bile acid:Na+ symporter, BASS family